MDLLEKGEYNIKLPNELEFVNYTKINDFFFSKIEQKSNKKKKEYIPGHLHVVHHTCTITHFWDGDGKLAMFKPVWQLSPVRC